LKQVKYIIRKRALGDVFWIEPVVRAMASKYRKIIVHTKYNDLFQNYPLKNVFFKQRLSFAERVLVQLEKKLGTHLFTINLDDAYEHAADLHILNAYQKKAGLPFSREYPQIFLSESEKNERPVHQKYAVLHVETFSDKKYRQIQGIDWNLISTQLSSQGYRVIQVGIKNENLENASHLKTSIRELLVLIYHASFFIGIDSGPSHIAAGFKIPSVILFGALDPCLRHFKEQFNGLLLKQQCAPGCNNAIIDAEDHKCALVASGQVPPCCTFSTGTLVTAIQTLIEKNVVPENYQ
jgi:ADP-heptose:LPS heptosyltransferase